MPELILASTSPYRRELLERLRIPFRCVAPEVDEGALQLKFGLIAPMQVARKLAEAKAAAVAERFPTAVVLGGDQICVCAGRILGKPETLARAKAQLKVLAGRTHELLTAVCLAHPGGMVSFVDRTQLKMRPLTPREINRYLAADEPLDCAGSYKLESLGISLFESIKSADHTAITGLPLMVLAKSLRKFGFDIP